MNVDFHIHTNYSDGSYSINDVLSVIEKEQICFFSITDHDSINSLISHYHIFSKNPHWISGIEFTCAEQLVTDEVPFPVSIHLLGYNFDPFNPELTKLLETRKEKIDACFINLLKCINTYLPTEIFLNDIPISCGVIMQLCDFKNYIQKNFPNYINCIFPLIDSYAHHLSHSNLTINEAISAIHNAGGNAIWAHPYNIYTQFNKSNLTLSQIESILQKLILMGIDGIETYYLDFSKEKQLSLRTIASKYNLSSTAGSDFHGFSGRNQIGVKVNKEEICLFR